jgi:hypothetical protein
VGIASFDPQGTTSSSNTVVEDNNQLEIFMQLKKKLVEMEKAEAELRQI